MKCKNCSYFAITDAKEWNGKEHCCFNEWGHCDWELAPCDDDAYADEDAEYNFPDDDYASNMCCDNTGFCQGPSCSNYIKCQGGK